MIKRAALVFLIALTLGAWGPAAHVSAAAKVVRVTLIDENGSGEDGSAQLTDQGDGTTKVELLMMNAPDGAVQPAHIHKGTCATLDPTPAYPLNDVTGAKSTTVVKVSLADLTAAHYAINVHKSAAEITQYISCGTLPLASAASSPQTADAALAQLLDLAGQMDAQIQKKEVDASSSAFTQYQTAFTAGEALIGAKSADLRTQLDTQMTAVDTALKATDFATAHTAATTLVDTLKAAQGSGASAQPAADMTAVMTTLQTGAADLVRETGNKDTAGAQAAYDAFHTAFTAHQADLTAKAPNETAEQVAAQVEVHNALQAGDWAKASKAAGEIQKSVSDAIGTMGLTMGSTQSSGASGQANAGMVTVMQGLQTGAADLVRETGNKDAAGAQAAYDAFHTAFTAHQADLTAKAPNETAEQVAAQAEVHDALQAGDWTKANSSAKEIQKSVSDAIGTMGLTVNALPTTGNSQPPFALLLLLGGGLALLGAGSALRRRSAH